MSYTVEFNVENIPQNTKVILPISMGQFLQTGERLQVLLEYLKAHKADITVLICDGLNSFNVGDVIAEEQGNKYIEEHQSILDNIKVIRWRQFISDREILFKEKLAEINSKSQEGSPFYKKMEKTWKKCLSSQLKENSLLYQRNEYAAILCMNEFDMLIYPKRITDGMAHLYSNIQGKKPDYQVAKIKQVNEKNYPAINSGTNSSVLFFKKKKTEHMHVALRMALDYLEKLLENQEIPVASKELFINEFENIVKAKFKSKKQLVDTSQSEDVSNVDKSKNESTLLVK